MLTSIQVQHTRRFMDDILENAKRFCAVGVVTFDTLETKPQRDAVKILMGTYMKEFQITIDFLNELICDIEVEP